MNKYRPVFAALAVILLFSCSSKQVGLKENWIDERDVMALRDFPIEEWMEIAGRPVIVEIIGDTNIYYYNYRPTMYAVAIYDSTTFLKTWGTASESKPGLANATEVWGSRKDIIQIKAVNGSIISATISDGPDKKVFVRDLHGNIVLDPNSGYNSNISEEQKIDESSVDFGKAVGSISGKNTWESKYSALVKQPAIDSALTEIVEPTEVDNVEEAQSLESAEVAD